MSDPRCEMLRAALAHTLATESWKHPTIENIATRRLCDQVAASAEITEPAWKRAAVAARELMDDPANVEAAHRFYAALADLPPMPLPPGLVVE